MCVPMTVPKPNMAPCTMACLSMARVMAWRTRKSSNGARVLFIATVISAVAVPSVTLMPGMVVTCTYCSGIRPTRSRSPAWKAAKRVLASEMMRNTTRSRYGTPSR